MKNEIKINGNNLDLQKVRFLIKEDSKIQAIKFVKDETNLGLKESKDIVDNLDSNPSYYDSETEILIKQDLPDFKERKTKKRKSSHVISDSQSKTKNYIILVLVIIIVFLLIKSL